jgi:hypothetical protein
LEVPVIEKGQKPGQTKAGKKAKRHDPMKTITREQKLACEPREPQEADKRQEKKESAVGDGKSARMMP